MAGRTSQESEGRSTMEAGFNFSEISNTRKFFEDLKGLLINCECTVTDGYFVGVRYEQQVIIRPGFSTIDIFMYRGQKRRGVTSFAQDAPDLLDKVTAKARNWLDKG
jgi:hypothetical protein